MSFFIQLLIVKFPHLGFLTLRILSALLTAAPRVHLGILCSLFTGRTNAAFQRVHKMLYISNGKGYLRGVDYFSTDEGSNSVPYSIIFEYVFCTFWQMSRENLSVGLYTYNSLYKESPHIYCGTFTFP